MTERIIIPLYGPRRLKYAEHPLVVPRLGVPVAEPTELIPARPERPIQPTPERPSRPEPRRATPPSWPRPRRRTNPEIAYFANPPLRGRSPQVIDFEEEYFSPIEHRGLIVVIETASFVPRETFEIVREHAEESGLIIPIYVRGIE
jgi:hypothetical protein